MRLTQTNDLPHRHWRHHKIGHSGIIVNPPAIIHRLMGGPLIGFVQALGAGNWDLATINLGVAVVVLLICFPLHELAHAVTADRLGDDTPRMMGRLTLNPAAHLNLMGSLLFLLVGFGWATTPINPSRLRGNQHLSHALVAVAGPVANLLIAIVIGLGVRALAASRLVDVPSPATQIFVQTAILAVLINLQLCLLNLLPIPPLDGWTIVKGLVPVQLHGALEVVERFQSMIVLLLFVAGGSVLGPLIFGPASQLARAIMGF
jgi:Zn-dependent protease